MTPKIAAALICLSFPLLTVNALAESNIGRSGDVEKTSEIQPDLENGKSVYRSCAGCHQPEGWGSVDGSYPQIAGQLSSVTIKQMADMRERRRYAPIMLPFTQPEAVSEQDIVDVAAYIADLPMNPLNHTGPGIALEQGGEIYRKRCAKCHGSNGEGDAEKQIPLIQAQNYPYLLRQFDDFRRGRRSNSEKMMRHVNDLDIGKISLVLDHVSRIRPNGNKLAEPGKRNLDFPLFVRNEPPPPPGVCKLNE